MAKGGSLMGLVGPAVLAGGVAAGVSYLDPFGDAPPEGQTLTESGDRAAKPKIPKGTGKEKKGGHGPIVLDPLIVSLARGEQEGTAPHLRVGLAIVTATALSESQVPALRDGFTAAARAVAVPVLLGPEGLDALRVGLNEAARRLLDDAQAHVLITDYVVI